MKVQKRIYFMPKTKIGKISFLLVALGFLAIIILNAIASLMQANDICDANGICTAPEDNLRFVRIGISLLAMGCILVAGITSIISIIKYRDYAIFLFLSALIGIMGIMFVLGEI